MKIFLDANVIFAATYSLQGAARKIFQLSKVSKEIKTCSNTYAINEAKINIEQKLGHEQLVNLFHLLSFLDEIQGTNYKTSELKKYQHLINNKDLPILLGAKKTKSTHLLTYDRKDFFTPEIQKAKLPFEIMLPGDFLGKIVKPN